MTRMTVPIRHQLARGHHWWHHQQLPHMIALQGLTRWAFSAWWQRQRLNRLMAGSTVASILMPPFLLVE